MAPVLRMAWSTGGRRSLNVSPGHLFTAGEGAALEALLTQILENGWDATLLPARAGSGGPARRHLA